MPKVMVLRGLPGSGKTTFAKKMVTDQSEWFRVNKDDFRCMMNGDQPFSGKRERFINKAEKAVAEMLLSQGKNVIVDNTHLTEGHLERWRGIARDNGASFAVHEMNVSLNECLARNLQRTGTDYCPPSVIINMARSIDYPDAFAEREIICDIDGTVADIAHRLKYMRGEKKDWKKANELMYDDAVRWDVVEQVREAMTEHDAKLIFVSARREEHREVTEKWLERTKLPYETLIMRHNNDYREDSVCKKEMLDKYFKKDRIVKIFDDRLRVLRMWEAEGLGDVTVSVNVGGEY